MKVTRIVAIGVIAGSLGLMAAQAGTLRNADEPAEFPPASYTGKQYVDSRGCIYIRAGIDGLVTWVPRVTRSRQALCGAQPTFAKAPAPQPNAAALKSAQVITPAAPAKPAVAPVVAKPKPAAKPVVRRVAAPVVVQTAPKPAPRKVVRIAAPAPTKPTPAPTKTVRVVRPAAVAAASASVAKPVVQRKVVKARMAPQPPAQVSSCPGLTGVSQQYSGVSKPGFPVRCGPQADSPVTVISRSPVTVVRNGQPVQVRQRVVVQRVVAQPVPASAVTPQTRVVPRHVYDKQQTTHIAGNEVPEGYRAAWDDDRLNPKRAHQTLEGIEQTDLAWTRTVPRKLYERATGRVVNRFYPKLVYPYTSMAEQRRAAAAVLATKGKAPAPARARVSTKQMPATASAPRGGYVQVGTFGVAANADKTAARLRGLGLPVRMGNLTRGGKSYRIVLAGPFAGDQIGAALNQTRRAGFKDAFVRK